jgi:hypothetical protein
MPNIMSIQKTIGRQKPSFEMANNCNRLWNIIQKSYWPTALRTNDITRKRELLGSSVVKLLKRDLERMHHILSSPLPSAPAATTTFNPQI